MPDDVAKTPKQRTAVRGQSLSAYVAAELKQITSRPMDAETIDQLHVMDYASGPGHEKILTEVVASRR